MRPYLARYLVVPYILAYSDESNGVDLRICPQLHSQQRSVWFYREGGGDTVQREA